MKTEQLDVTGQVVSAFINECGGPTTLQLAGLTQAPTNGSSADPMYFVDSGRPLTGASPLLKTRRHMRRDAARKPWRKLQKQGWRQLQPQWGADMEV